jgi:hypothetical protein
LFTISFWPEKVTAYENLHLPSIQPATQSLPMPEKHKVHLIPSPIRNRNQPDRILNASHITPFS